MHLLSLFRPLEELESGLAEFYTLAGKTLSATDEPAAVIFKRLALEEKTHVNMVRYQKRLASKSPELFGEIEADLGEIDSLSRKARTLSTRVASLTVREMTLEALSFESSAAEYHLKNAMRKANPSMAPLLRALGGGDREHFEVLHTFAVERGFVDPAGKKGETE
jgi:hypothetical protein